MARKECKTLGSPVLASHASRKEANRTLKQKAGEMTEDPDY